MRSRLLRETKRFPVGDAHRLKQTIAQHKAAVVHGHDRPGFRQKLPVEKNHHEINS